MQLKDPNSILSTATPRLTRAIQAVAVPTRLRGGELLFSQGDKGEAFYIVQTGTVEISVVSEDGRKLALDVMRKGEVFGEIALFGGDRTASARALADCVLLCVRRADVLVAIRKNPDLLLDLIDVLCDRLRQLSVKLEERAFLPVPVRLARRLLYLDAKLGASGRVTVSQAELADFVGATREGVAKTLATWRSRDWVAMARGSILILDRGALETIEKHIRE